MRHQVSQTHAGHQHHDIDLTADQVIGEIDSVRIGCQRYLASDGLTDGMPPMRSMRRAISSARRLSNAATRKPLKLGTSLGMIEVSLAKTRYYKLLSRRGQRTI